MRFGFGLVGLLVTVGLIVMMLRYTYLDQGVMNAEQKAQDQGSQISGHDANGEDARKSATLTDTMKDNKVVSYTVTAVTPGGGYESYFGLKVNDEILGVIDQGTEFDVNDTITPGDRDTVLDAYEKGGQLKVNRPGVGTITLPLSGTAGRGPLDLPGLTPSPSGSASPRTPSGAIPSH
jgi:hypothetical protein